MSITPAIVTPAPPPSTARTTATAGSSFIERYVGECVAGAAGTIALALSEFQDRGLTSTTKMQGGEAIAKLYKLRQYLIGTWDFDAMAQTHGRAVLRDCCGSDVTDGTVNALVSEVLAILANVVRDQLN